MLLFQLCVTVRKWPAAGERNRGLSCFVLANRRWPAATALAAAPSSLFSLLEHCDLRLQVSSMSSEKFWDISLVKHYWTQIDVTQCWCILGSCLLNLFKNKAKRGFMYCSALILGSITFLNLQIFCTFILFFMFVLFYNPSFRFHL